MKRSHIVSILKNNRFMCNKTKNKNKKLFCKYCLQCFSKGRVLLEHKEICFKINGRQILKWRSGSIKFTNYFKQLAVLFNIYANFKSFLKGVRGSDKKNNTSCTEKYQRHIPFSFASVDDKFSKPLVIYRGKIEK